MRKISILFFSMLLILVAISGCRQQGEPNGAKKYTQTVKLYYADKNNEKLVTEERKISYDEEDGKYRPALEELIKGPKNKNYRNNIPPETKIKMISRQGSDLIVNLSREFNNFAGSMAEILAVGSIVNTMTQFEEVERVKILVNGEEFIGPSGEPRGYMTTFPLDPTKQEETKDVTLYFGNQDATAVVGETRQITVPQNTNTEGLIRLVLEELVKGPEREDLKPTIPKEVKILSVKIQSAIAEVDFSEEMYTKHGRGATGEAMTINSIVNTLTEFPEIQKVKMTVVGQPMNIEHAILEEPVGRNEEMIQK